MNYYNEFDPKAAAWLRELITAGEIPPGDVDERSITEVKAHEITRYTQHHFFAGIGGWPLALRLAGWYERRPVCTASLPCQPFSNAGKQEGASDDRHLWPVFFDLAKECGFERMFGEQVARAIGFNWLDGISADLEAAGYAVGSIVLGAHSVGAPHRRQRLYWMADSPNANRRTGEHGEEAGTRENGIGGWRPCERGTSGRLADGKRAGLEGLAGDGDHRNEPGRERADATGSVAASGGTCSLADSDGRDTGTEREQRSGIDGLRAKDGCPDREARYNQRASGRMGNATSDDERRERESRASDRRPFEIGGSSAWSDFDIIPCRDGKARRIESGTFPLVAGIPRGMVPSGDPSIAEAQASAEGRQARLKGYGNSIVPELAAQFILATEDALHDLTTKP